MYGAVHQRGARRQAPSQGRRDEVVLATKFGNVRDAGRHAALGVNGRPEYVRAGLRRQPAAARRRPHRPLLPAPRRPGRADRGDRRRDGRAGPGRQGPPPRPVRGGAGRRSAARTPSTRSPRCRPSTRCGAATRRTRSSPTVRELGIGFVAVQPARPRLPDRQFSSVDDLDAGRLPPRHPALPGRELRTTNLDARRREIEDDRATSKGCTPGAARARVGARPGRRHRADPRHQADHVPRGERRRPGRHAHARRPRPLDAVAPAGTAAAGERYQPAMLGYLNG